MRCIILALAFFVSTMAAAESSQEIYAVGDKALGGTVFYVNTDGTHGYVVANTDQGETSQDLASNLCSDLGKFDSEGQYYTDWYVPSGFLLKKIYSNRFLIGEFKSNKYWESTGYNLLDFAKGTEIISHRSSTPYEYHFLRCVRSF